MKNFKLLFYPVLSLFLFLFITQKAQASVPTALYQNTDFTGITTTDYIDKERENVLYDTKLDLGTYPTDSLNRLTICMWVKPIENINYNSTIFEETIIRTDLESSEPLTGMFFGIKDSNTSFFQKKKEKKAFIEDTPLLYEQWNFVALVYDNLSCQYRLVLNDTVYSTSTLLYNIHPNEDTQSQLSINAQNIAIDDISIYNKTLSLDELEQIKGSSITADRKKYEIIDKSKYSDIMDEEADLIQLEGIKGSLNSVATITYKVIANTLPLSITEDVSDQFNNILEEGALITITDVSLENSSLKVKLVDTPQSGWISLSDYKHALLPKEASSLMLIIKLLNNPENISPAVAFIILPIFLCLIVLLIYCASKLYDHYTNWHVAPIRVFYLPISLFFLAYMVFNFISSNEATWFFSEGLFSLPKGYSHFIHWFIFFFLFVIIAVPLGQFIKFISCGHIKKGILFLALIIIANLLLAYMIPVTFIIIIKNINLSTLGALALLLLLFLIPIMIIKANITYINNISEYDMQNAEICDLLNKVKIKMTYDSATNNFYENNNYQNYSNTNDQQESSWNNNDDSSQNNNSTNTPSNQDISALFVGVTTTEQLKKRYKDLLKIYHPDNQSGDTKMSQYIHEEYERRLSVMN